MERINVVAHGVREVWDVPDRRSQYLEAWLHDRLWRETASPRQLGRYHREITVMSYLIMYHLRGRARDWASSYATSLQRGWDASQLVRRDELVHLQPDQIVCRSVVARGPIPANVTIFGDLTVQGKFSADGPITVVGDLLLSHIPAVWPTHDIHVGCRVRHVDGWTVDRMPPTVRVAGRKNRF